MPLTFDVVRTFLPPAWRSGRLVAAWHRPALISMVALLCASGYYMFWSSVLPYSREPTSAAGLGHAVVATALWVNTVYNYIACAAVDPGVVAAGARASPVDIGAVEGGRTAAKWPSGSRMCPICEQRVLHLDHHCPL